MCSLTSIMETAQNETLSSLIEEAKGQRLSPAKEDQAVALLKELLLSNREGIQQALDAAIQLSWGIGVKAVGEAWTGLKDSARRMIIASLNKQDSEQGRRIRMSIARGLFTIDPSVTLKMTAAICGEFLSSEPDAVSPRDRQNFANVFIGKGKPWLHHLDIASLRPIDAGRIIQCATMACFPRQVSPFTQLCLIRWIAASGRFSKQPVEMYALMVQGIERWQPKFCKELLAEVPELPDVLRQAAEKGAAVAQSEAPPQPEELPSAEGENTPIESEKPFTASEPEEEEEPERTRARGRRSRSERGSSSGGGARFDIGRTLQDVQRYVAGLEKELSDAKEKLRRGEGSSGRGRPSRRSANGETLPPEEMQSELESLRRYNEQLEDRCKDLRSQIDDLAGMQEEIASKLGAGSDDPVTDATEQFQITLGVKLRKDFEDFQALEREPEDEVFREHYRILLKSVFETLGSSGIRMESGLPQES